MLGLTAQRRGGPSELGVRHTKGEGCAHGGCSSSPPTHALDARDQPSNRSSEQQRSAVGEQVDSSELEPVTYGGALGEGAQYALGTHNRQRGPAPKPEGTSQGRLSLAMAS